MYSKDQLKEIRDRIQKYKNVIIANKTNTYALTSYGAVLHAGAFKNGQKEVEQWFGIDSIAAGYTYGIFGLKNDHTVVQSGVKNIDNTESYDWNNCLSSVTNWKDIQMIIATDEFAAGLRPDGSVETVGHVYDSNINRYSFDSKESLLHDVGKNIMQSFILPTFVNYKTIFPTYKNIIGIKQNGNVSCVQPCEASFVFWVDIGNVISSGKNSYIVGIGNDGVVLLADTQNCGILKQGHVDKWRNVVDAAVGGSNNYDAFIIGLKDNGEVYSTGNNQNGQCKVSKWTDIVEVTAGRYFTVGLRADGTVVSTDPELQDVMSDWKNIIGIYAGDSHVVGLRSDGTVVAAGDNYYGQCNVQNWSEVGDIIDQKKADERQKAELKRNQLVLSRDSIKTEKNEYMNLRAAMKERYFDDKTCLYCGKKHFTQVKICKKCGALNEKGVGSRGIAYRKVSNSKQGLISCQLFEDDLLDVLLTDNAGKVRRKMLDSKNLFSDSANSLEFVRTGENLQLYDNGLFGIVSYRNDMIQSLNPNGVVSITPMENGKINGIAETIFPGGRTVFDEYDHGKVINHNIQKNHVTLAK